MDVLEIYRSNLEENNSVLVRMKTDLQGYVEKNQPLTDGQRLYVKKRVEYLKKLSEYQSAADETIIYLNNQLKNIAALKFKEKIKRNNSPIKAELKAANDKIKRLETMLNALGWPPHKRAVLCGEHWKETKRSASINEAKQHFNF